MPRYTTSAPRLLEAVHRQSKAEDKLTEVFATTLGVSNALTREFVKLAGLADSEQLASRNCRFEVRTQVPTGIGQRTIDLEVRAYAGAKSVGRLWSEHKISAAVQDAQFVDAAAALRSLRPADARVIGIFPDKTEAEAAAGRGAGFSWQEIAQLVDARGRTFGADWRNEARRPVASAEQRVLDEFLWYLEERTELAVTDPLTSEITEVVARSSRAWATVEAILDQAASQLGPYRPTDLRKAIYEEEATIGVELRLPKTVWRVTPPPSLVLIGDASDEWALAPTGAPSFGAGLSLDGTLYSRLVERSEWLSRLESAGFGFHYFEDDRLLVCLAACAFSDVIANSTDLAGQSRYVAQWAHNVLNVLASDVGSWGALGRAPRSRRAGVPGRERTARNKK